MGGLRSRAWVVGVMLAAGLALGAGANAQSRRKVRPVAERSRVNPAEIAAAETYGEKSAPITIEEYSDFECPSCRALYIGTLRPLIDDYVSSGKVYLVHHNFPLSIHQYSQQAAEYADAAAAIGRFERVEDALFSHQSQWAADGKIQPIVAAALTPAEAKAVEELAHSSEIASLVQQDVQRGTQLGIRQTPTLYITHKGQRQVIAGLVSFPILRRYLDALLQQ
ncbi:MAG TPA: thioredoxin domain-containing protein [Candidatus Acidoferrales bacterium]|nr:thioredoxin domain-containing protein [Candidatus Acidoferrales bacterium]